MLRANLLSALKTALIATFLLYCAAYPFHAHLKSLYEEQLSVGVFDRNGERIALLPNIKGHYAQGTGEVPREFGDLLIKKEDRLFYYHAGVSPLSIVRDTIGMLISGKFRGSSTLTQQLVKNLLNNGTERTFGNKAVEALYAFALELYTGKKEILRMYADIAYFGKQAQGLKEAARYYYGKDPETLTRAEILELLATLSNPSNRHPGTERNEKFAAILAEQFGVETNEVPSESRAGSYARKTPTFFEAEGLGADCAHDCALTIDGRLTEALRGILARNLDSAALNGAENGAIVAIKLSENSGDNELLTIVGSPNPLSVAKGQQINMALEPRPAGSTVKPFLYAKAFEKGARPYTVVDDREYQYEIGTGFYLYPKNYDGKYRGRVTLHQALSNSLNVPAVKTLEFVGVELFNDFLEEKLRFRPRQELENYALGIALGGLETDLLTLAQIFTIFPNEGILKPMKFFANPETHRLELPMATAPTKPTRVVERQFVQLVNKILSDRNTGVDQFGSRSNLNLPQSNYAVKTGTSYDYHDSWTIGYTPDFLVGVWIGNSSNRPIDHVSGQSGAGKVWHETMELLLHSPYNLKTEFHFDEIREFEADGTLEYGLPHDDYTIMRGLMDDRRLIRSPHHNDTFADIPSATIPFASEKNAVWYVDGKFLGSGEHVVWVPSQGTHTIRATYGEQEETIRIEVASEESEFLKVPR